MREVIGDIFEYPADAIVIPTNWTTKRNGEAVMGAGVAKEAAKQWPWLPAWLGARIRRPGGPRVEWLQAQRAGAPGYVELLLVPTKHDWRQPSTLPLIELGARTLVDMVDGSEWQTIALPRLGCGERTGRLLWPDVRLVLAPLLDDRFVVCHQPAPSAGMEGE